MSLSIMDKINHFSGLVFQGYIDGVFGVFSGLFVNNITIYVMDLLNMTSKNKGILFRILIRIFIQIFFCVLLLALFEEFLLQPLALQWKTITPGFIFFALFFTMQFGLFDDAMRLTKLSFHKDLK